MVVLKNVSDSLLYKLPPECDCLHCQGVRKQQNESAEIWINIKSQLSKAKSD